MKLPKTIKIKKCRLCKSAKLKKIFSFGNFYVSNFVEKKKIKNSIKAPLELVYCKNCDLLQLKHSAPQELLYRGFYWYRSGVTSTMIKGLKDIYSAGKKIAKLKKNDVVLDIGANDGTLLKFFKKDGIKTLGCEPAKNLTSELKKNCDLNNRNIKTYNFGLSNINSESKIWYSNKNKMGGSAIFDKNDPELKKYDTKNINKEKIFIKKLVDILDIKNEKILVKIDVERHEKKVLEGMEKIILQNGIIMQIEISDLQKESVFNYLKKMNLRWINTIRHDHYFTNE